MRACNKCQKPITQDEIGFEGEFPDWNYELDLCIDCVVNFKGLVDEYCNTVIDTNTMLSEVEKAEREPVSKAGKLLKAKKDSMKNVVGFKSSI